MLDKNVELIRCLKDLDIEIKRTPRQRISSVSSPFEQKLDYIFQNIINIHTVDIDALIKLIDENKFNYNVKNFIIARLFGDYDKLNNYNGCIKRQRLVEKHVFKIIT